jgi:hypothetical protein
MFNVSMSGCTASQAAGGAMWLSLPSQGPIINISSSSTDAVGCPAAALQALLPALTVAAKTLLLAGQTQSSTSAFTSIPAEGRKLVAAVSLGKASITPCLVMSSINIIDSASTSGGGALSLLMLPGSTAVLDGMSASRNKASAGNGGAISVTLLAGSSGSDFTQSPSPLSYSSSLFITSSSLSSNQAASSSASNAGNGMGGALAVISSPKAISAITNISMQV